MHTFSASSGFELGIEQGCFFGELEVTQTPWIQSQGLLGKARMYGLQRYLPKLGDLVVPSYP
jgi:hypothetical protein